MPSSESTAPSVPSLWLVLLSFALAVVDTLIFYRLNALAPVGSLSPLVVAIATLFGVSTIIAAFWLPTFPYWGIIFLMLGGIVVGAVIDVIADSILFSGDHPLFPIEIAFLWIVSIAPIALGALLGRLLHARRDGTRR